jgi:hypothetical protein
MMALLSRMRPRLDEARQRVERAVESTREALTPEQWARLPESIRLAADRMGGMQRGTRRVRPPG